MNAYELALHLQVESSQAEYGYIVDDWKLLDDAANMLRQQAEKISNMEIWEKKYLDRIAELENQLDKYSHYEAMTHQEYMQQIMQLEKEKIRAYNNGYEDGWKSNTQLSTQLHPIENDK